jgi:hypothetical protein
VTSRPERGVAGGLTIDEQGILIFEGKCIVPFVAFSRPQIFDATESPLERVSHFINPQSARKRLEFQVLKSNGARLLALRRGRAGEIRTHDLLHPMQAFYQAELRPAVFGEAG